MSSLIDRMIRAAKLEAALYEEVEADQQALPQAMTVVVLSSFAAGIGNLAQAGLSGIVIGTFGALIGWYVWALITYLVGTKLIPGPQTEADIGQLLRTTGFSSSPGVLRVLGVVPLLGPIAFIASAVWMLVAMVVAVRQALDYESTGPAVAVCIIGFVAQVLVLAISFLLLGGHR